MGSYFTVLFDCLFFCLFVVYELEAEAYKTGGTRWGMLFCYRMLCSLPERKRSAGLLVEFIWPNLQNKDVNHSTFS